MTTRHVVMIAVLACAACTSWKPVYSAADAAGADYVRIETPDGKKVVLDHPSTQEIVDAFEWARTVDVRESDGGKTALLVLGCLVGGALLLVGFAVILSGLGGG